MNGVIIYIYNYISHYICIYNYIYFEKKHSSGIPTSTMGWDVFVFFIPTSTVGRAIRQVCFMAQVSKLGHIPLQLINGSYVMGVNSMVQGYLWLHPT